MKKYTAQELKKIREGLSYMNKENFTTAMSMAGFLDEHQVNEHFRKVKGVNIFHLLENEQDFILSAVLNFYDTVVEKAWHNSFHGDRRKTIVKIVFKQNDKVLSKELDLNTYSGAKEYCSIHENGEGIRILNQCDNVQKKNNQGYMNIFEGDVICNHDSFHSHKGTQVFLAFLDKQYIYPQPYYKKLIFTKEFGFLNPANDEPLTEKGKYEFKESVFNLNANGVYNYHCFTLGDYFSVIGNMFLSPGIFKELKDNSPLD